MTEKTNALRILDCKKIPYTVHTYSGAVSGTEVASALGQDVRRVFKTLVTVGKSHEHYVFVIPAAEELDLKKAASLAEEKNIEMLHAKELFPLTGYIHGGCSPIGMKKQFQTFFHKTSMDFETIFFSGGRIGLQIEVSPKNVLPVFSFALGDLVR